MPRHRVVHLIIVATLTLLIAPALALGVGPSSAAPQTSTEPDTASTSSYVATCLQSARSLSALFLFDQSGSLGSTDPNGVRYDGLRVALRSLSQLTRSDGRNVAVEAAISSFDHQYYPARDVVGWTRLNEGSTEDMSATVDRMVDEARDRTAPQGGTNFGAAMQGAYDDLKDRGSRGSCRVVFWFTDGQDERGTVSSPACQAGSGLIDTMRRDGIVVVGLQLDQETDDLKAIATGSSGTVQCGQYPIPSDSADGAYIFANDSAALRRLFGSLGNLIQGCTPQGNRGGMVDPGVRGMGITIDTPSKVTSLRLDSPDGTTIPVAPEGASGKDGYRVLAQSDDSYVNLTVDFPPGRGVGAWTVLPSMAVPPDAIQFCVYSGLHLARVDPKASPTAGRPAEIVYHAVDSTGKEADLGVYKQVAVGASAKNAKGEIRKTSARRQGNSIIVTIDSMPVDARLQLELTARLTTVSGLDLTPLAVDEGVGLQLSKAFPTVSPIDELNLGAAIKEKSASAPLTLFGSPLGASKVCIDTPTAITVPDEVGSQTLDVQTGCIDLKKGETRQITVGVTPTDPTVGNGEATLPIRLVPVASSEMAGQESAVGLPIVWRYENPRETTVLIVVIVLASLISLFLPLAALSLANRITARFETSGLSGELIPVVLGEDGPRRVDPLPANPSVVVDPYLMSVVRADNRRRFRFGDVSFVSKAPWSPFTAPTFSAIPVTPGYRVLSNVPGSGGTGASASVPPALGFVVVALVAEDDLAVSESAEIPATLVVLLRDKKIGGSKLDGLMNSRMQWSVITEQWRREAQLNSRSRHPDGDDFTGAPGPAGPDPATRGFGDGLYD